MKMLINWRKAIFAAILLAASPLLLMAQDNTEASGYAIVKLSSPAAVYYRGGIKNLKSTAAAKGGRFDSNSAAFAAYRKHLDSEQAKFVSAMGRAAPQAVAVRKFHATANAVVVELNGLSPGQLKKISGAKDVYESQLYQPNMNESVKLVNAPAAWTDDDVGGQANAG
jgi:hypothetical protein